MDKTLEYHELLNIRKATIADAINWYVLLNSVWRDTYEDIFPEEVFIDLDNKLTQKAEKFANTVGTDDQNIAYVAEYNKEIVGVMKASLKSGYEHFASYADLMCVYINPKFQGLGIGTKFKNVFES